MMQSSVDKFNEVLNILKKMVNDNITENILIHYWELLPKRKVLLDWIDIDKINWNYLCENINAIDLLRDNQDKINWNYLCLNINGIELLKDNQDKIDWYLLSLNKNGIELLKRNQDKINWKKLSINKKAIYLLKKHTDKIDWKYLSKQSRIFDLESIPN